jgi:hypothetical protein
MLVKCSHCSKEFEHPPMKSIKDYLCSEECYWLWVYDDSKHSTWPIIIAEREKP